MHAPEAATLRETPLTSRERLALPAALAAAAALRVADIFIPHTPAPDQEFSVRLARMSWRGLVETTAADTHSPFYYGLLKIWFLFTPETLVSAQILSVVFAVATLWVVFRLARELFSPAAGWAALACAAVAPYQIYWNHSARNLQLLPLGVALVVWLTYRYLARPGRARWWALAAAWVLTIQANYMGLVFGLVWGAAFIVAERAPWRVTLRLAAATIPGLLSFAPWAWVLAHQLRTGPMNFWFFQETVSPIYLYYHALFGAMVPYQPPNPVGIWFMVALLVFTLMTVAGWRAIGRRWSFWVLLLLTPIVPIELAKRLVWTMAERHLFFCVPVFMAYWGAGCVEAWRLAARRLSRGRIKAPLPETQPAAKAEAESATRAETG